MDKASLRVVVVHIEMGMVADALMKEGNYGHCKEHHRGYAELCSETESIGVGTACVERYNVGLGKEREEDGVHRTA